MQEPATQEITTLEASACKAHSLFPRVQNGEIHESVQE
ncbi:hypothetical protein SynPROS91_01756 [Synechococcus sp. PROS-9-1]|nr:hypothetical protein SynPROS91_01756 [Synechococcus sp. PROS-9-1]